MPLPGQARDQRSFSRGKVRYRRLVGPKVKIALTEMVWLENEAGRPEVVAKEDRPAGRM